MPSRFLWFVISTLLAGFAGAQTPAAAVNTDPGTRKIILPEPANPRLPTLFLIGDSTVRNGSDDGQGKGDAGQWGWGNPIAACFDLAKINVVNRAVGGLSSRTYLTSGHWERTLAFVKAGDFVIMQFGHNDDAAVNDTKRARGTLKGVGDETEEIDNLLTNKHEVVHSYGWYLKKFVADTRAKGATPVICSLIPRKAWDAQGKVVRNKADYADWAAQVARQEKVDFIDLNELVASRYDELGRDAVLRLFPSTMPDEHTHTNGAGAELNANIVIAALKALPNQPLKAFMTGKAAEIVQVDPTTPVEDDRPVLDAAKIIQERPANPKLPTIFFVGDSTVKSGGTNGAIGWGERISLYFDPTKINTVNQAMGGRSSRTFSTEGRWNNVLSQMKAGDFVIIQFGHNDGGKMGDPKMKNRASAPGTGPEIVEDTKPDGSKELVHSFGWYLAKYVSDAKAKCVTVILCSPIPHRDKWENGRDFEKFAQWGEEVAKAGGAYYFDLTMVVTAAYKRLGVEKVNTLFSDARTHTNAVGAQINAGCVIAGLKSLPNDPLSAFFSEQGAAVSTYSATEAVDSK